MGIIHEGIILGGHFPGGGGGNYPGGNQWVAIFPGGIVLEAEFPVSQFFHNLVIFCATTYFLFQRLISCLFLFQQTCMLGSSESRYLSSGGVSVRANAKRRQPFNFNQWSVFFSHSRGFFRLMEINFRENHNRSIFEPCLRPPHAPGNRFL